MSVSLSHIGAMNGPRCFSLLVILALVCLQSRAESSGSVMFIDSPSQQYLRSHRSDGDSNLHLSMSSTEIGAAASVLLGLAPPATLSAASSSKLNAVLMPNPFVRPLHVLMLQVKLGEGSQVKVNPNVNVLSRVTRTEMVHALEKAQIELPGQDEIGFLSLDDQDIDFSMDVANKEFHDFALGLGGSYVGEELMFLLPSGVEFKLDLSKKADLDFARNLVSLTKKVRKAMEMRADVFGTGEAAELISGSFHGIKALEEEYGSNGIAQQGMELFLVLVSKIFDSVQSEYQGQVVGIILFDAHSTQQEELINIVFTEEASRRWLEESKTSLNPTLIVEVALVRKTLAWATGIVLIIATLLGVCCLMCMPVTKDTLLYSNVKLD